MEIGGKSPFIIFEGGFSDGALEGLVDGILAQPGQVCRGDRGADAGTHRGERRPRKLQACYEASCGWARPLDKAIVSARLWRARAELGPN